MNKLVDYYWAGFFAADGYLKNGKAGALCLSVKDIEHLKNFKLNFKLKNSIYVSKTTTNTSINFTNKRLVRFFNSCNITPKKSLTLKPPLGLTKNQIQAYIIGYIDGDGTIGINTTKYKNKIYKALRLRIIGTPELLNWISKFFNKTCKPITHCNSKIYIISINDNKLLSDLVNFSERYKLPSLKRKWDKVRNFNGKHFWNASICDEMYMPTNPITEIEI